MAPILATYRADGAAAGMDHFLRLVGGDGYRPVLDRAAPGAFDDAVAHAAQFFAVEWPAVARWNCGAATTSLPSCSPCSTSPAARARSASPESPISSKGWLPHAVRHTIDGTTHLLIADQPQAVGACLATFWAGIRHA